MVKVEEVGSASLTSKELQNASIVEEQTFSDDDLEEDDFDINESITDRLVALKDIIPPQYRSSISNSVYSLKSLAQSAMSLGGKSLWVISSSTLLLGVPLSLCILSEQQLIEMEKGMGLTDSSGVLAGGIEPEPASASA